jgi:hypothetical protein
VQKLATGIVPQADGAIGAARDQPAAGAVERKRGEARAIVIEANALVVGEVCVKGGRAA